MTPPFKCKLHKALLFRKILPRGLTKICLHIVHMTVVLIASCNDQLLLFVYKLFRKPKVLDVTKILRNKNKEPFNRNNTINIFP